MARVVPFALATLAAVAVWLSFGVLAVVDRSGSRIGALPPWWLLVLLVVGGAAIVAVFRPSARRLLPLALAVLVCLPWLPGRLPPALLIWYGSAGIMVWTLIGLGLGAPAFARVARWSWVTAPGRAPWVAALAAAVVFGVGARALQSRLPAGDEPHYLIMAQSLLYDGDLRIENNHGRGDYFPYHDGELRPDYLRRGLDGQIYSIHAPGLAAVLAPAFLLGGYPAAVLTLMMLSALGTGLLWTTTWLLTGSVAAAWAASAGWALSAPGYFHAFTVFPDGPGAVLTIVALWLLVRLETRRALSWRSLAGTGAALALLPWLHTRFAVIAAILGLVLTARLVTRNDRIPALSALLAIPLLSALAWFGFFWSIWGTPNPAAPYGGYTQSALSYIGAGLSGLLFDQQFGLMPNAPIYALSMAGLFTLARSRPRLALEIAALLVPYAMAVAAYRMWWGGFSAPARFLVAVLPAAALPLGAWWSRAGSGARAVGLVLLAAGAMMIVPRIAVEDGALLYNTREGFDLMLDWANRSVNLPLAWPSLHRDMPIEALADASVWLASALLCGLAAGWLADRFGSAWTLACAAAAVTVMVASTVVWSRSGERRVTPSASALDMLHRWPVSWHAVGWQSHPPRVLPASAIPTRLEISGTERGPAPEGRVPLFSAPLVPAGEFEVVLDGASRPDGQLTVAVGRPGAVLDVVDLAATAGTGVPIRIRLPVRAHSITIDGDDRARLTVARVLLRPLVIDNGSRPEGTALHASRYGSARVFVLDDNCFLEPTGFWIRGRSTTEMVVDAGDPTGGMSAHPIVMAVRAGPLATWIELAGDAWSRREILEPGESRSVTLPPTAEGGAWRLRLETGPGFRPVQHEEGSRDYRNLGVWIAFPPANVAAP